ncbi:MAG: DUF2158 domain-containing protein [Chitinophagaceae bacterium]
MANEFKTGDLVKLKLSNQYMTIKCIEEKYTLQGTVLVRDNYECVWYNGQKRQKAIFHKDMLQLLAPYFDEMHFANYE